MSELREYDVITLFEYKAAHCIRRDTVRGSPLIEFLRDFPIIQKNVLSEWISSLRAFVEGYRDIEDSKGYDYLNPYTIIVSEDNKLYPIDLESESNADILKKSMTQAVTKFFHTSSENPDLFALERVSQFIFARSRTISPHMFKERRLSQTKLKQNNLHGTKKSNFRKHLRWVLATAAVLVISVNIRNSLEVASENVLTDKCKEQSTASDSSTKTEVVQELHEEEDSYKEDRYSIVSKYESEGDIETATDYCIMYAREEFDEIQKSNWYETAVRLLSEIKDYSKIKEVCLEAVKEFDNAKINLGDAKLKVPFLILYTKMILVDENIEESLKQEEIKALVEGYPEIRNEIEFNKLNREYGILEE
ncbi:MAG: hypothetical protein LBQ95_00215 [Lachnospiraceae bacterium]|nr:hypothetical protein [Lachnospiraceae bacterium]